MPEQPQESKIITSSRSMTARLATMAWRTFHSNAPQKEVGTHTVSAIAVAIEHDGYATDVDGIDGGTDGDM